MENGNFLEVKDDTVRKRGSVGEKKHSPQTNLFAFGSQFFLLSCEPRGLPKEKPIQQWWRLKRKTTVLPC